MANSLGDIFVRLGLRTKDHDTGWDKAEKRGKRGASSITAALKKIALVATGVAAAVGAVTATLGGFAIKWAAEYETGLVSVVKVTGLAGKELEKFEKGLEGMRRAGRGTAESLLGLASVAGQMGVKGSANILRMTETMAKLEKATDVVGEDGARSIARVLNITGEGVGVVDRFGAALVQMGNSAAATESEIVHMATFVGQSIGQFGVKFDQILGLSTAMKELGLRAQSAGGAVGRAFIKINTAIQEGGEKATEMAKFLGLSVEEMQKQFRDNSVGVFVRFLERLKGQGDRATVSLTKMGLAGDENLKIFPTLARNVDLLRERLEGAAKARRENLALDKEAAQAADTFTAQIARLKENFKIYAENIGKEVLPALKKFVTAMNEAFSSEPEQRMANLVKVGKAAFTDLAENLKVTMRNAIKAIEPYWNALLTYMGESFRQHAAGWGRSLMEHLSPGFGDLQDRSRLGAALAGEEAARTFSQILEDGLAKRGPVEFEALPGTVNLDKVQDQIQGINDALDEATNLGTGLFPKSKAPGSELFEKSHRPRADDKFAADFDLIGDAADVVSEAADDAGSGMDTVRAKVLAVGNGVGRVGDKLETVKAKVVEVGDGFGAVHESILELPNAIDVLGESADAVVGRIGSAFEAFVRDGEGNFKQLTKSILADLALIQVKMLALRSFESLSKNTTGIISSVFGAFAKSIGGARAFGGPVSSGKAYLVGEKGPELFSPAGTGNVIPNNKLGGGTPTVVQHIDLRPGVSHEELARILPMLQEATLDVLSRRLRNGGQPAAAF